MLLPTVWSKSMCILMDQFLGSNLINMHGTSNIMKTDTYAAQYITRAVQTEFLNLHV
jgi:hypothetical protein